MRLLQNNRVLCRSDSHSQRPERSWRPGPIQALLATGSLASLCVIFLLIIQNICPVPTKLTLQKDAAELARLETQLRLGNSHSETRSLPSAAVADAGTERIDVKTQEHLEFEAPRSALSASRMSSVDRKRDAGSGGAKKHLRPFKRGMEGRPDYVRNLYNQMTIAPTREHHKLQGLGSFLSAMSRTLGFSTHRDPM
jgi:hypothetical protein